MQAQKVYFSRKRMKLFYLQLSSNSISVSHGSFQKHLGIFLDDKLNFNPIKEKNVIAIKETGVIQRLSKMLP